MNLILHHALKDLRAQRWLVGCWAVVLAATATIEAFKLSVPSGDVRFASKSGTAFVYLLGTLALARVALAWVLAIRFVHADPAEGTDAFWLTRPISRRALLAAKAVTIGGVLLLVPAVVAAIVFTMNGMPLRVVPLAVGLWLVVEALFLLPLTLLATITRDLARMVLAVLAAAVGWAVVQVASVAWMVAPIEAIRETRPAWLLIAAAAATASALLAGLQYLGRRTPRTAMAAGSVLVVLVVLAALWPGRTMLARGPRTDRPEWKDASRVTISVPPETVRLQTRDYASKEGPERIHDVFADIVAGGLADQDILRVIDGKGSFRVGSENALDIAHVYSHGLGDLVGDIGDAASRRHFERAIGARMLEPRLLPGTGLRLLGIDTAARYAPYQGRPGTYEATLEFTARRIGAVSAMPLRSGASAELDGVESTILAIQRSADRSGVGSARRYAIVLRQAAPRAWLGPSFERVEFVIRNRRRGEAMVGWNYQRTSAPPMLTGSFVVTTQGTVMLYMAGSNRVVDDDWLADAELVVVALEPLGRFEKTIRIDDLVLPPAPAAPAR
jgi:hypothetical protein